MPRRSLALVALVALLAACGGSSAGATKEPAGVDGVTIERTAKHSHRKGAVDYGDQRPPSGGDHAPIWLTCGAYAEPVPTENAVHSLEHGAVWIAYDPALDATAVRQLDALASQPKVIVSPLDGMAAPIVLVAWEHRLLVQSVADPRIEQFIEAYGDGAVAREPDASCEGGVGTPDA